MEPEHRALLRVHRMDLSDQLLVSDTIVPFLYQENILTRTQVEDIESLPTSRQKSLRLLDVLPNCGPRAFHAFLLSLEDFRWVREQLVLELQTQAQSTGERLHRSTNPSLLCPPVHSSHQGGSGSCQNWDHLPQPDPFLCLCRLLEGPGLGSSKGSV